MTTSGLNPSMAKWYEENSEKVFALMHDIWAHPELGLHEHHAAKVTAEFAKAQGFTTVELHAAEDFDNPDAAPNSVIATWGSGKPVIAFVGELDALPDLGNEAVPYHAPIPGAGHGCGHNLMAGGAAAAASALKYAMEQEGLQGTVKLIEAPAEEIGCGKGLLAHNHVFEGLDLALMWHQFYGDVDLRPGISNVIYNMSFEFHGKTAHPVYGYNGRSAADAVQLMNLGCEFMREHEEPESWIAYCIRDAGIAINQIPEYSRVDYQIRVTEDESLAQALFERVKHLADGAALMTDTTYEYHFTSTFPQFRYNKALHKYVTQAAEKIPPLQYTEEDYALAREFYRNLNHEEFAGSKEELLPTGFTGYYGEGTPVGSRISTDAAVMSYFCPSIHTIGLGMPLGTTPHSWITTFAAGCALGQKAGLYGYQMLAQTGYDALTNPELLKECWAEFHAANIPPYKHWTEM